MVHEGVMGGRVADPSADHHLEVSTQGVLFFEQPVEYSGTSQDQQTQFIFLKDALWPLARGVNSALPFFSGLLTNLLIRCELHECQGVAFLHVEPSKLVRPELLIAQRRCTDHLISVSTYVAADDLRDQRIEILTDVLRRVLWAFSYRAGGDFKDTIERSIKASGLA